MTEILKKCTSSGCYYSGDFMHSCKPGKTVPKSTMFQCLNIMKSLCSFSNVHHTSCIHWKRYELMTLMAQTHEKHLVSLPEASAIDPASLVTKDLAGSAHGRNKIIHPVRFPLITY